MKFTVFGTKQDDLNIDDIECLTDVMSQLDLIIDSYNDISVNEMFFRAAGAGNSNIVKY